MNSVMEITDKKRQKKIS